MPFGFFFLYSGVLCQRQPLCVRYFLGPVFGLTVMGSFWGLSAALVTFANKEFSAVFMSHPSPQPICWRPASSQILCSRCPPSSPKLFSLVYFSRHKFRRCRFRPSSHFDRYHLLRFSGPGRRQRNQHHARDPGAQPTHLASADFPVWSDYSPDQPFAQSASRGPISPRNLSGHGIATRNFH